MTINDTLFPILELSVEPVNLADANFTKIKNWTLVNCTEYFCVINITFEYPEFISQNWENWLYDSLVISWWGVDYFVDYRNLTIQEEVTRKMLLPVQKGRSEPEEFALSLGLAVAIGIVSTMAFVVFSNFFLAGLMQFLLNAMHTLNILVHMTLVKVNIPRNVSAFFAYLLPIVLFDPIIDSEELFKSHMNLPAEDKPLSIRYEELGYISSYAAINLGSIYFVVTIGVPVLLILELMRVMLHDLDFVVKPLNKLNKIMYWEGILNFVMENFLTLELATL